MPMLDGIHPGGCPVPRAEPELLVKMTNVLLDHGVVHLEGIDPSNEKARPLLGLRPPLLDVTEQR